MIWNNNECGDAHFRWSPVIDRLKSPQTDCSNHPRDLCPIYIQFYLLVVSCPIVFMVLQTSLLLILFPNKIKASVQRIRQTCWTVHPDHRGIMFWLKWVAMYSVWSKRIMLFLCGLCKAPSFLKSFKGIPSPSSQLFRGYFHPSSSTWRVSLCVQSCQPFTRPECKKKSYGDTDSSIWILSLMRTASCTDEMQLVFLMLKQLFCVLFGHKCLVTNVWSQMNNKLSMFW